MSKKSPPAILLAILLPVLLVFWPFFTTNSLAWGDAPFYWDNEILNTDLFSLWRYTGESFGGINMAFWLVPLESLVKIYDFLGVSPFLLNRFVFYLPALYLSFASSFIFGKYLNLKSASAFLLSFFYVFNTYFLMVIDGGQVGIALAYSLFPLGILSLLNLNSSNSKLLAVLFSVILSLADPRFLVIAILAAIILKLNSLVIYLPKLVLVLIPIGLLNAYWILPLLASGGSASLSAQVAEPFKYLFLNGLAFYHPSWPENLFGIFNPPDLVFYTFPVLVFLGFARKINKQSLVLFAGYLFFVVLVNGDSRPLGFVYGWGLQKIPLASMFRDSTKFFAPVVLFGGVFIAKFAEVRKYLSYAIFALVVLAIVPGIFKFNFVLSGRDQYQSYVPLTNLLKAEKEARVLWVPEKPPLAYVNSRVQPISATDLADYPVFAFYNPGTRNRFGYLESEAVYPRLQQLGVKYIILSGNFRAHSLDEEEALEWRNLKLALNSNSYVEKINLDTAIVVYKIKNSKPHIYEREEMLISQNYEPYADTFLAEYGFELENLSDKALANTSINASREEVALKLLQNDLQSLENVESWAYYDSSKRLEWQYQLLMRDFPLTGFDYGRGIGFSSEAGESFVVHTDKKPVLAIRAAGAKDSVLLVGDKQIEFTGEPKFAWYIVDLPPDSSFLPVENRQGLVAVNTYVSLSRTKWEDALQKADEILQKTQVGSSGNWVFFIDNYSQAWRYKDQKSVKILGGFNGFFVEDEFNLRKLRYEPQKYMCLGLSVSGLALVLLVMMILWTRFKSKN